VIKRWWRAVVEEIVWVLDLDDGTGAPSLTKVISSGTFWLAVLAVLLSLPVSGTVVALVIIAMTGAFGRSAWMRYLGRGSWNLSASDRTETITERVTREDILSRRGEDGTEPAGKVPQVFGD
jgi:hydroxyethylthiazole kinase-like sugar kinase family protein